MKHFAIIWLAIFAVPWRDISACGSLSFRLGGNKARPQEKNLSKHEQSYVLSIIAPSVRLFVRYCVIVTTATSPLTLLPITTLVIATDRTFSHVNGASLSTLSLLLRAVTEILLIQKGKKKKTERRYEENKEHVNVVSPIRCRTER